MDNNQQHLEQLAEIRSLMDRSSRFISLSGLSGVFAGLFALAGAVIAHFHLQSNVSYYSLNGIEDVGYFRIAWDTVWFLLAVAVGVLVLSIASGIFFTARKAKKHGQKMLNKVSKRMLINLAIPLVAGGVFCMILIDYNLFLLALPTTLIFYGLALINSSKYTLIEIKYLGLSEVVLGLVGCLLPGYALIIWAIGFGILHIFYGAMMYYRYERA